jgi:flagellar hook-associated protein FlgK
MNSNIVGEEWCGVVHYFFFSFFWRNSLSVGHGLLIHELSRLHTTTHHTRKDSSGRVITTTQRPLPHKTQHSQLTSLPLVEFEPTISAGERPQTYALDRAASGTGWCIINIYYFKGDALDLFVIRISFESKPECQQSL